MHLGLVYAIPNGFDDIQHLKRIPLVLCLIQWF